MTTVPKEVNKIADKSNGKNKPVRKPVKGINELPVVKKKLRQTEIKIARTHSAGVDLLKAVRKFEKHVDLIKPEKTVKKLKPANRKKRI